MPRGKAYAILEVGGDKSLFAMYASHTGGTQNPVMRDVPRSDRPNTMVSVPTGGEEYIPLEVTVEEKEDEGLFLDELYEYLQTWQAGTDAGGATTRRDIMIRWQGDPEFSTSIADHKITGCYPSVIGAIEGERNSPDPRSFSVTFVHIGSTYQKVG